MFKTLYLVWAPCLWQDVATGSDARVTCGTSVGFMPVYETIEDAMEKAARCPQPDGKDASVIPIIVGQNEYEGMGEKP